MKIVWFSDFDPIGSGYQNLSTTLATGLVERGHEVKAVGLHYNGQEHTFPFSIIPINDAKEAMVAIYNLRKQWQFDLLIVALDIHLQSFLLEQLQRFRDFKYVGIMPVESDPLTMSWAMVLLQMDLPLIISEFGTLEALNANVSNAQHIPLGVSEMWVPVTAEEKQTYRKALFGITDPDTYVVLTVADNQERKNLWGALETFKMVHAEEPNSKYVLVTRSKLPVGYVLQDLIGDLDLQDSVILLERGMPREQLHMVYGAADAFLLTSKAEGLGLPLMEAMKMKIPCVATDCTGMRELLEDKRGILVPPEYVVRDVFGNGHRYWINIGLAADSLLNIKAGTLPDIAGAKQWIDQFTWARASEFLHQAILKLGATDEKA